MGGKLLTFYILVIMFSGTLLYVGHTDVEAVGKFYRPIRFIEGEEEQIADVSPGANGSVFFPGIIMVETSSGSEVQDVFVSLNGSTGLNWPVTIVPSQILAKPGIEETFTVKVLVPPETSNFISDTLTVSGTAEPNPGTEKYNLSPITGSIRIAQFYKFALECDDPSKDVGLGEQVQFQLKIWNYGNGRDTFAVRILDLDKLSANGFTVELGTNTVEVDEKSLKEISIMVKAPSDKSKLGNQTIEVEVKSEQQAVLEGSAFPKTYPIKVEVKDENKESTPGFEVSFAIVAIAIMIIICKRRSA
jgi:hypothetical protein